MKLKAFAAVLILFAAGCGSATEEAAQEPGLRLEVFTSSPHGYSVTSTIVEGPNEVMVIDPQFLLTEADNVITRIEQIGKPLTLVYSSHAHPDHMFGVARLKEAYPDLRWVMTPEAVERAQTGWPGRRNFWIMEYSEEELPGEVPVPAEPLAADGTLMFDGETMQVTKEVIGADGAGNSFVYIPSLNAVVAGDIIFHNSHFGIPGDMDGWNATIAQIEALNPEILVAGHQAQGTNNDPAEAIGFMRTYISDLEAMATEATSAAQYEEMILAKYPNAALRDRTLPRNITAAFPPPDTGKGKAKGKGKG